MFLTRSILVLFACLLLISCADEVEDVAVDPAVTPQPASTPVESQSVGPAQFPADYFKVAALENPEANSYKVQLSWIPFDGSLYVFKNDTVVASAHGGNGVLEMYERGGAKVELKIEVRRQGEPVAQFLSVRVQVPEDYVLSGRKKLSENLKIKAARVFIAKGTVIMTENHNLVIEANSLISENAVIQNFPLTAKASREQNGRSGGAISIIAQKAEGDLFVRLNAEEGGEGKIGAVYKVMIDNRSCAGTNGGDGGNAGSLSVQFADGAAFNLNYESVPGKSGKAGARGQLMLTGPQDYVIFPCDFAAASGSDGRPGVVGIVCVKKSAQLTGSCK
ncbi:MAG: hypothetical protein HUU57_08455 [Bdellovibrio sp.]|nr:hypothetical protein [Bdellovibrio sp.]